METYTLMLIALSFLLISCFYSMAGFGGGSSYLAILSLIFHDFYFIRTNALLCNIAVVSIGCWLAHKEGKLHFRKIVPYALLSVPAAFFGAQVKLSERTFFVILGTALIFSAFALFLQKNKTHALTPQKPVLLASFAGGGIGFLSGMVGIGGGIFLSPILNLLHWEKAKDAARISGFFILVNSVSGLSGLVLTGAFSSSLLLALVLLTAVIIGGYTGTKISLKRLDGALVRKVTGILVFAVGIRLLLIYGFNF